MTIPKWLLPVVGVIAAIAVGVAAVLIGMRFTPPVAPVLATEPAPVLAPAEPQDGDTPFDVSDTVGVQEIVTPGQPGIGDIDTDAQAEIDALNDAGGEEIRETGRTGSADPGDDGADAPLDADDPCATVDPPDGCPVGVTGIVLADIRLPSVPTLYLRADPQSTPGPSSFSCDGDTTPGNVWIDVATTVPVDLTLTYSPVDDPADERSVEYGTSAADRDAWNADYDANHHTYRADSYWWFHNCIQLTGLSNDDYTITATATDIFGRVPDPVTSVFSGRGNPVPPPMNAVPLGAALLYVSVPSPRDVDADRPIIRAWVVGDDEGTGCDGFEDHTELTSLDGQQTYPVEESWLTARNYLPNYLSRDVEIYSVPEGSQVVVCARWFSRPDHSWETWVVAQSALTVASPDIVTPTISIESVQLGRQVQPQDLRVGVSMPGGVACGGQWLGPEVAAGPGDIDPGVQLCDAGTLGFDGRVVVTTGIDLGDEDWAETSSVLQLARTRCAGDCPVPAPSHYLVNLAAVRTGSALCSGEGCTPPTTSTSAGRVVLAVTWDQGNVNHATRWRIGGVDTTVPDDTTAVAPQLDINNYGEAGHSADGWTGTITMPIETDRDAHFRAMLSGSCFPDGYVNVPITGTVGPTNATSAHWSGLCPEGSYFVAIELWDDEGNRQTYSYSTTGAGWWPGSFVAVQAERIDVSTLIYSGALNASHEAYGISYFEVSINGMPASTSERERLCTEGNEASLNPANGTTSTTQTREYTVVVTARVFRQDARFARSGGPESQCGFERIENGRVSVSGTFTYEELMRGVRLYGPGTWAPGGAADFSAGNLSQWTTAITLRGTRS